MCGVMGITCFVDISVLFLKSYECVATAQELCIY